MFRKDIIIIPSQENSKAAGKISKLSHHETESQGKTRRKEAKNRETHQNFFLERRQDKPLYSNLKLDLGATKRWLPIYYHATSIKLQAIDGRTSPQFKWIHVQVEALWPVRNYHVTPFICPTTGGNERWEADILFTSVALQVRWQHQWLAMEMTTGWETKWFARVPFQHNGWVVSNRWCLTLWLRDSAPTCENASEA